MKRGRLGMQISVGDLHIDGQPLHCPVAQVFRQQDTETLEAGRGRELELELELEQEEMVQHKLLQLQLD